MAAEDDPVYLKAKIAHEETLRAVTEQDAAREAFRNRASGAMAVATLASGLFGFGGGLEKNPLFWVGLGGFGLIVASVLYLYQPHGWRTNPAADASNEFVRHDRSTPTTMLDRLVKDHQENVASNAKVLQKMILALSTMAVGLMLMVACWTTNAAVKEMPEPKPQKIEIVDGTK